MSTNDNSLDFGDIVTDIENLDTDNTNLEENFEQLVQNVVFGESPIAGIENLPPVENLPQVEINGQQFVIINGQQILLQDYLDAIQANGEIVIPEPEAQLSGGASASPFVLGSIGPDPDLTELLPPTALQFPVPEERELDPFVDEDDTPTLETEADVPSLFAGETQTPEAALPEGTSPADPGEVTTGDINIDTGNDQLGSLVVIDVNGNEVDVTNGGTVQGEYGILEVIVDANGEYSFEYTLTDNTIDHPEAGSVGTPEGVSDSFDFIVTDDDGDTASDTLVIDILDDGPVAVDDSAATGEDQPITIDVFADDTEGADGVDVADITFDDTGTDGTVVYNGDGTFTFTPDPGFGGETTFTYTIIDADGDPSTATVTITVPEDSVPTLAPMTGTVDEGGLNPDGTTATEDTEFASGEFTITTGNDTVGSLVIDGVDVTNGGIVTGDYGTLTVTLNSDGSYSWAYELTSTEDHPTADLVDTADGIADIFDVELTDSDGDVVESTITIDVLDDGPISIAEGLGEDAVAVVDESPLSEDGIAAATIDASTGFATEIYGADGAGSVEYALELDGVNVGSGLYALGANGAAGEEILLNESGGVITGSVGGVDYFTIEIDASTGEVTFTQLSNIWHADGTDADDASSMNVASGMLVVEQTVTDADGDTATSSFDIGGGVFIVEDDGPSAEALALGDEDVAIVDESPLSDDGMASAVVALGDNFSEADFGTDGAGSVGFALILDGEDVASGLYALGTDGAQGEAIVLNEANGVITGSAGDVDYFTITVDADGNVTFTQLDNVWHETGGDAHDDASALAVAEGALVLEQTITDADGDTAMAEIDLGAGVFSIEDDGPASSVMSDPDVDPAALVDESDGTGSGDDGIPSATISAEVVEGLFTPDFGTDGAGTTEYALMLEGSDVGSGLYALGVDGAQGEEIVLNVVDGDIVGTSSAGTHFTISIEDGAITFTLGDANVWHEAGEDAHDDASVLNSAANTLVVEQTVMDADGDTASSSYDLGSTGVFTIQDDGPSLTVSADSEAAAEALVMELDESIGVDRANPEPLPDGETADGNSDDIADALAQVTTNVADGLQSLFDVGGGYGSDGEGTISGQLSFVGLPTDGTLVPTNLSATDGGSISLLYIDATTVHGVDAANDVVFSIEIVGDQLQTTLFEAIDHGGEETPDLFDESLSLLLTGDDVLQLQYEVTRVDADGDSIVVADQIDLASAESSLISFDDDGPSADIEATGAVAIVDESIGTEGSTEDEFDVPELGINNDETTDGAPVGAIGYVTANLITFETGLVGQDIEGASFTISLNVPTDGTDSGVDTTDGTSVSFTIMVASSKAASAASLAMWLSQSRSMRSAAR